MVIQAATVNYSSLFDQLQQQQQQQHNELEEIYVLGTQPKSSSSSISISSRKENKRCMAHGVSLTSEKGFSSSSSSLFLSIPFSHSIGLDPKRTKKIPAPSVSYRVVYNRLRLLLLASFFFFFLFFNKKWSSLTFIHIYIYIVLLRANRENVC